MSQGHRQETTFVIPTVAEAMRRRPLTIDPEAPLGTALATMVERGVRHLPVVDDNDRLIGMLTDRDVRSALIAPALAERLPARWRRRGRELQARGEALRVRDAMTWDCVTTSPDASLAQAAAIMLDGRFGCLPVVEKRRLVGIVTERDVLRALADRLPALRGDVDDYFW
jgi:acetoin utilization protein AcuB